MYMILNQPPPKPSVLNGSIDRTVEAIVLRCLAKDPAERPESADALRALVLAESREGKPA
jgi:serine/threonine protein kinase